MIINLNYILQSEYKTDTGLNLIQIAIVWTNCGIKFLKNGSE
jgi:hypothetical protein